MRLRGPTLLLVLLTAGGVAFAEDDAQRQAREELERELKMMVGNVPTKVRVDLVGLDDPNYGLEEAVFEIDGKPLKTPSLKELSNDGVHLVFHGDIAPGKHKVTARLVYANTTSIVLSDEGGYKWKVGGDVSFELRPGIEVQVKVTPARDPSKRDIAKRFVLSLPATPVMLAVLDDGSMPEPPPKPKLTAAQGPVDAGVVVAAAPKLSAKEEAKRKAEEAKQARLEEAKRKADEARAAREAKLEEARRKAEEAKAARLAKLEEAKRVAEAGRRKPDEGHVKAPPQGQERVAARAEAAEAAKAADAQANAVPAQPAPPDAEQAAAREAALARARADEAARAAAVAAAPVVIDAGAPAVVAAQQPVEPPPATASETGLPWPILAGAGAGGLFMIIVLVLRRRGQVPKV